MLPQMRDVERLLRTGLVLKRNLLALVVANHEHYEPLVALRLDAGDESLYGAARLGIARVAGQAASASTAIISRRVLTLPECRTPASEVLRSV